MYACRYRHQHDDTETGLQENKVEVELSLNKCHVDVAGVLKKFGIEVDLLK